MLFSKYVEHNVTWIWPYIILHRLNIICWVMLIKFLKFNKQIVNTFAKEIIGNKGEFITLSNIWDFLASHYSQANSEYFQTSKLEHFAKIVKKWKSFTIFAKTSFLDVWEIPHYASKLASKVKGASFLNQFKYQMGMVEKFKKCDFILKLKLAELNQNNIQSNQIDQMLCENFILPWK